jgi:hypothetical protein
MTSLSRRTFLKQRSKVRTSEEDKPSDKKGITEKNNEKEDKKNITAPEEKENTTNIKKRFKSELPDSNNDGYADN